MRERMVYTHQTVDVELDVFSSGYGSTVGFHARVRVDTDGWRVS